MKIITFSLFGDKKIYCQGAVENARLAKQIYPSWLARFYVEKDVPKRYVDEILSYGAEVVECESIGAYDGLNWRFRPFNEEGVDVWISRDCDSRLSHRERVAVEQWLESDRSVHLIRDSHNHAYTIMAGMFGVNNSIFNERYGTLECGSEIQNNRDDDQSFLNRVLWPLVEHDHFCHDHWRHTLPHGQPTTQDGDHVEHNKAYGGVGIVNYVTKMARVHHPHIFSKTQPSSPFPFHEPMEHGMFVGQIIDENNKPIITTDTRWEYELRGVNYE